jgi:hypothetical protein
MRYQVSGKLQPDQAIDAHAGGFRQVQEFRRQHLIQDTLRWIWLERYGHDFHPVTGLNQHPA